MDSMGALLGHALRENIELRLDVASDVWPIETDIAALELALLNLAVNARDAMPDGGTLILSARNEPLPNGASWPAGTVAGRLRPHQPDRQWHRNAARS